MKKIFTLIAIVILLVNTLTGLILTSYSLMNWLMADFAIILGLFCRLILNRSSASDGMKISFNFILSFFTLISFILAVLMPDKLKDNLILIFLIISIAIQGLIGVVPRYFTEMGNSKN
jgi:hypothetical protein